MTNTLALALFAIVVGLFLLDGLLGLGGTLFMLREFADLIEWLAFWR